MFEGSSGILARASCTRLSPKRVCPASMASRTFSAGCVFVIATSSTSSADRPDFAAAFAICSRTHARFSAIEVTPNCRAGARPANSFVSASDALALREIANTADASQSVDHRLQATDARYYLLANRSATGQNDLMKRYSLLLAITVGALSCSSLLAQEKASLQPSANILSILQGSTGKTVELRLNCGEKIGGKVEQVNDNLVLLSHLTGAEFFDGFVNVKDISAVVIRSAGK